MPDPSRAICHQPLDPALPTCLPDDPPNTNPSRRYFGVRQHSRLYRRRLYALHRNCLVLQPLSLCPGRTRGRLLGDNMERSICRRLGDWQRRGGV